LSLPVSIRMSWARIVRLLRMKEGCGLSTCRMGTPPGSSSQSQSSLVKQSGTWICVVSSGSAPVAVNSSPPQTTSTVVWLPLASSEQQARKRRVMYSYTLFSSPVSWPAWAVGWMGGWALSLFFPFRGVLNPPSLSLDQVGKRMQPQALGDTLTSVRSHPRHRRPFAC
jgi:hypothetical protein